MTGRVAPPIPVACAARPLTHDGLVIPFVNAVLADGGADFRVRHTTREIQCWTKGLCQVCASPLPPRFALMGTVSSLLTLYFDEAPMCLGCARYAAEACSMIRGDLTHYASGPTLTERSRGKTCFEPGCDCGGWVPTPGHSRRDTTAPARPAEPWVYVIARNYSLAVNADGVLHGGLVHPDDVIRVRQVSTPGKGPLCPWVDVPDWRDRYRPPNTTPAPAQGPSSRQGTPR